MYFCYVDESGGFEPPDSSPSATPVMAISGLILPSSRVPAFTRDFLDLKRRYFPGRYQSGTGLSHILIEAKGAEILQMTRSDSRNKRRQAQRVRADFLQLLKAHHAKVIGRVWVKEPGRALAPIATYTSAIQDLARHFSNFLVAQGDQGLMICDAREHGQNRQASHSVFTDKFRTGSDPIPAIPEVPLFAHSENHAGLQASDLVASTFLFPMACVAYCGGSATGLFASPHESPRYDDVRRDSGTELRGLQHRYRDENGRWRGGIVVSDRIGHKSGAYLFESIDADPPVHGKHSASPV